MKIFAHCWNINKSHSGLLFILTLYIYSLRIYGRTVCIFRRMTSPRTTGNRFCCTGILPTVTSHRWRRRHVSVTWLKTLTRVARLGDKAPIGLLLVAVSAVESGFGALLSWATLWNTGSLALAATLGDLRRPLAVNIFSPNVAKNAVSSVQI